MCDDFLPTDADKTNGQDKTGDGGFNRRQFAVGGAAAAALAGCTAGGEAVSSASGGSLAETAVNIRTADGVADAQFIHPASGAHPGVILWPDIAGPREAFTLMARRLATAGYAVLVVNQYYRSAPAPVLANFAEWRTQAGQEKLKPMIGRIDPAATTRDAAAFVGWLDTQDAVDKRRRIGAQGYCMGGPFAVRTAAAAPQRMGAAASFHGGGLVVDAPDSPHRLLARTEASYLIAIGQDDDARAPTDKDTLRAAAAAAGRPAEIEVYPAKHGWCVPDSPVYDKAQADRAWGRLLALYAKL